MGRSHGLQDRLLTAILCDLLRKDRRLDGLDLSIEVRGAVAHIAGTVHSNEERQLVRRLAGPLRGVCVVWDRIQILGCENIRVIDIGCAKVKQYPWAIGIDRARYAAVDLRADLEFGLPIADSSVLTTSLPSMSSNMSMS
jgi:BON domain